MSKREELRAKILEKVGAAKEALTEEALALACGEAHKNSANRQAYKSALFVAVFDELVSKREVVLDDRAIYDSPRVRLPEHKAKPLFQAPVGPTVKVWRDPSVIDPALAQAAPATKPKGEKSEIVSIKLPASMQVTTDAKAKTEPLPAAAKAIAQPTATTRVRADGAEVESRLNTAWNELIAKGAAFTKSKVCDRANVARSLPKRERLGHAMATAIGLMAEKDWDAGTMQRYRDLPNNVETFMTEFGGRNAFTNAKLRDAVLSEEYRLEAKGNQPAQDNAHLGTIADLERRVAVLLAENAELKSRSSEPAAAVSQVEVLVGKVKALDVELNRRHSEALAHAAETQRMENQRTDWLKAIAVLKQLEGE